MGKYLLIAEKFSLMRDIRNTYVKNKNKIPYDIDFLALAGHICCYAPPVEYPNWDAKWGELNLPMIPEKWKINVIDKTANIFTDLKKKISSENYEGFICATDPEREGNLIYHLVETKLNLTKKKTLRLWINDTTEEGILKAFREIKDFHKDTFQRNLTLASVLRSRFDWIVGMNLTVAASVKSGITMRVGRVKTPTLNLVYKNSKAIENFVPSTSYQICANYNEGFNGFYIKDSTIFEFDKKDDANSFLNKLPSKLKVTSVNKEKTKTQPPRLYKLSDIQIEASKKHGFSPERTLDLIQKLYDNQLVSYPRCDCCYISEALCDMADKLINSTSVISEFLPVIKNIKPSDIARVKNNKRYVNDVEVNKNSHTALVPTTIKPDISTLSDDELIILKMIYQRFLAIFLTELIEEKTTVIAEKDGYMFRSNGKVVLDKGFTEFLGSTKQDTLLPIVNKGDILTVNKYEIKDKTTTPPERLTDGTLIKEMVNVGKYIEDENLKKIMNESKGIGTQATRSAIIKELIKDGYIDVKKSKKVNYLYISPLGEAYINNLSGLKIINPELTSEWEQNLRDVEEGKYDAVKFNQEMIKFLDELLDDISKMKSQKPAIPERKVLGKCPRCGNSIVEGKKSYGCLGFKSNPKCDFSIWKDNSFFSSQGKKLTPSIVEKLLKDKNHKTLVKGFKSKKGTKYDANVVLEDSGTGFANIKIEFLNKK